MCNIAITFTNKSSSRCGTHYLRVEELTNPRVGEKPPQIGSTSQKQPGKRERCDPDDNDVAFGEEVEDEMPRYRRIRLRSQKVVLPEDFSPKYHEAPWSQDEDQMLIWLVNKHTSSCWDCISSLMGQRTPEQCRERYQQVLEPTTEYLWVCVSNINALNFSLLTIFQYECGNGSWPQSTTESCLAYGHIRYLKCQGWGV